MTLIFNDFFFLLQAKNKQNEFGERLGTETKWKLFLP